MIYIKKSDIKQIKTVHIETYLHSTYMGYKVLKLVKADIRALSLFLEARFRLIYMSLKYK